MDSGLLLQLYYLAKSLHARLQVAETALGHVPADAMTTESALAAIALVATNGVEGAMPPADAPPELGEDLRARLLGVAGAPPELGSPAEQAWQQGLPCPQCGVGSAAYSSPTGCRYCGWEKPGPRPAPVDDGGLSQCPQCQSARGSRFVGDRCYNCGWEIVKVVQQ